MTALPAPRPGRNEPCRCGSGKKYKHCCLAKDDKADAARRAKAAKAAADAPPPAADAEAEPAAKPGRPPKPQTHQPWKAGSTRGGFIPRPRTPRKVGGG